MYRGGVWWGRQQSAWSTCVRGWGCAPGWIAMCDCQQASSFLLHSANCSQGSLVGIGGDHVPPALPLRDAPLLVPSVGASEAEQQQAHRIHMVPSSWHHGAGSLGGSELLLTRHMLWASATAGWSSLTSHPAFLSTMPESTGCSRARLSATSCTSTANAFLHPPPSPPFPLPRLSNMP